MGGDVMTTATLTITPEMQAALSRLGNSNVFITGKAGTGKSTLLQQFCGTTDRETVVLAPTGIAALNVGGTTIHSFFRFKPGVQPGEAALAQPKNEELYRSLECMVIDEVSMVRADLLDSVDSFLSRYGPEPGRPFGGVAVAFFGDPYQLAPVVPPDENVLLAQYPNCHFFSAWAYSRAEVTTVELTHVFRQEDRDFLAALDAVRDGTATSEDLVLFNNRVQPHVSSDYLRDAGAMMLTARRDQSDRINQSILESLHGQTHTFQAMKTGYFPKASCPTGEKLTLKQGARVMLLANNPPEWVNGTMAVVERILPHGCIVIRLPSGERSFVEPYTWEQYRYTERHGRIYKECIGDFTQLPVRLAWALTIHKVQGLTLEQGIINLESEMFTPGQMYVALSRMRTLDGLTLTPRAVRKSDIIVDPAVRQFMKGQE